MSKLKVIVIVGPTASGKTSLAISLAQRFNGEVISADSRQVYRGLDLGTGKVTKDEMADIPHHLIDIREPDEVYTMADFVRDGRDAIDDIHERKKIPIIAGGTFFYVDALLGKVSSPSVPPNQEIRDELEILSNEELFERLKTKDKKRAGTIDRHNKRRLVRAIEIAEVLGTVPDVAVDELYDACIIGIKISKEELKKNIHTRLMKRIGIGMIEEVRDLLEKRQIPYERLSTLGIEYRYIGSFVRGEIGYEEMIEHIETKSWQFAKRQMTWLKGDADIVWVEYGKAEEEASTIVENFL